METVVYNVACNLFSVSAEEKFLRLLTNYEPFVVKGAAGTPAGASSGALGEKPAFALEVVSEETAPEYAEETRQQDEGQEIVCGHTPAGDSVFDFFLGKSRSGVLVCSDGYRRGKLYLSGHADKFAIDNSLMVMYALATAGSGTALFHSAIVSQGGHGYMFLGKSGTGKSTHARLWLRHVEGAELVNDDNPVVRLQPDGAWVYGSPWSGKTPCYRNVAVPLGGIVLLSQAPYNKIARLGGVQAYAALVPSISGKRWDRAVADGLHATENALAMGVKVWHLECLPDEEAARLCFETVKGEGK